MSIDFASITQPTLLVCRAIVERNIKKMAAKLSNKTTFRPHFKTHQNLEIGNIFRKHGVTKIAVSSLDMANFFAADGWDDITISIPANLRQIDQINELAKKINLSLIVDSTESAEFLLAHIKHPINLWLEINVGQNRSGFDCDKIEEIKNCTDKILQKNHLIKLQGILTHAGHSYACKGEKEISDLYFETLKKLQKIKAAIATKTWQPLISFGDTPCCSVIKSFDEIDEIRPGNFVYFDISQKEIGSCAQEDIAVAAALPVISLHPERNEVVLYGGAVHLSKEFLEKDGQANYGNIVTFKNDKWLALTEENKIIRLSQEHGILKSNPNFLKTLKIGDLIYVSPVHSCLTADLLRNNTIIF